MPRKIAGIEIRMIEPLTVASRLPRVVLERTIHL